MSKVPATVAYDVDREPTPHIDIQESDGLRQVTLHKGAFYRIDEGLFAPMEDVASVKQAIGLEAALIAEIDLGPRYQLFLFDRGQDTQGLEMPVIAGSKFTVSDRYLLADMFFLTRANLVIGTGKDIAHTGGLTEICNGSSVNLGRDHDEDDTEDAAQLPLTVSRKHATVSLDFNGSVYISDNNLFNLTRVVHRSV